MKRTILMALVLVLAGCAKEARATLAEIYFPLNVGNSWTYTNGTEEITFTIIGTEEIDGHTYYKFDRFFNPIPMPPNGEDMYWLATNVLLRYDSIADRVLSYCRFGSDRVEYDFTGNEWISDPAGLCRLKSDNVICSVPAGEFSDCLNFQFGYFPYIGPDAAAFGEYLAPSVGVIKFVRPGGDYPDRLEGQDVTFMLKSYTIIPEPATLLLFGLGGLLLRKRN